MIKSEKESYYFCSYLVDGAEPILQILLENMEVKDLANSLLNNELASLIKNSSWFATKGYSQSGLVVQKAFDRWLPRIEQFKKEKHGVHYYENKYECEFIYRGLNNWISELDDLGYDAPIGLWIKGKMQTPGVSIVGSRAATSYGKNCAFTIAKGLVLNDYSVVSGGAYGIDAAAHLGALHHEGHTAVVFANGFGNLYPKSNIQLFEQIVKNKGCWVSEYHPEVSASKWRFLQRNRIVSALGQLVLVVESGWRSGTKNTVNHAFEIGRQVGVVPGDISSPMSVGCHELLKENNEVNCITSAKDITSLLEPISAEIQGKQEQLGYWSNSNENRVLDALGDGNVLNKELIAVKSGLSIKSVVFALRNLQIDNQVFNRNDKWGKVGELLN
ncbi:MAG: DNA-processing protein DprA [Micrococcaceae bacterium]